MSAPVCAPCAAPCRRTNGAEIYPHHPHLADKPIWKCDGCGAYVGCHPGTTDALGTPADKATRIARMTLHEHRIDPLWKNAWREPAHADSQAHLGGGRRGNSRKARDARRNIAKAARSRVYAYLADRLGISRDECHTGLFDLERCRAARRALTGVTYSDIRAWALDREAAGRAEGAAA